MVVEIESKKVFCAACPVYPIAPAYGTGAPKDELIQRRKSRLITNQGLTPFIYFETDAEVIFDVCKNHIPELAETINKMIRELSQKS